MAADLTVLDGTSNPQTIGAKSKAELEADTANLAAIVAKLPTLGQQTSANSLSITFASNIGTLAVTQSGAWNVTNITGTVSLPTGASTSAKQDTIIGYVDGIEAALTTLNTSNSAIQAAVENTTTPAPVKLAGQTEYETVAASQTAQALGATGATGDFISHLLVIPATTSPGAVTLLDNATSITVFAGGASSVSNLTPFAIPLCMLSVSGAWKVTTGADVSVIAVGDFT